MHNRSLLKGLRRQLRVSMDRFTDWRWRIDTVTGTWAPSEKPAKFADNAMNVPLSYYLLLRYLAPFLKPGDVFYDIGCGNGRVICYAARKPVSKVIGIELSAVFAEIARENGSKLRNRKSPIEVRCGDATEMDYKDGTLFFLFNPFGETTLRAFLERVRNTTNRSLAPVRFVYCNPLLSSVFQSSGWLKLSQRRGDPFTNLRVELWTSCD